MIQPISQFSYTSFKNNDSYEPTCVIGSKEAKKIKSDKDFRKKIVEQNERMIFINGIQALTILCGMLLFNTKLLIDLISKKKSNRLMPTVLQEFTSLKNDSKIPTIENCKSINKNLKEILQKQISQSRAGVDVISETGNPQASNRLLLYGPAGVGKSFFAKIFAKSLDAEYMEIMYSDVNSMWAGEGVNNLKTVFEGILNTAQKNPQKKYVVTLNEIDSIVVPADKISDKTKGTHWVSILKERSVFLNYLEILKEKTPNVTIIGTTNISPKNNGLDRAAMSRFQNLTEVPYPDSDCLYEALKMNLDNLKNKDLFMQENDERLKKLAKTMADRKFSFRNLEYIVNEAKSSYLEDKVKNKDALFNFEYLKNSENTFKLSDGELENVQKP